VSQIGLLLLCYLHKRVYEGAHIGNEIACERTSFDTCGRTSIDTNLRVEFSCSRNTARMPLSKWRMLSSDEQAVWDMLSDATKALILGPSPGPSPRAPPIRDSGFVLRWILWYRCTGLYLSIGGCTYATV